MTIIQECKNTQRKETVKGTKGGEISVLNIKHLREKDANTKYIVDKHTKHILSRFQFKSK